MATYDNEVFENQTIELDGNSYETCRFVNCNLTFSGGEPPRLVENAFEDCRWSFEGAAAHTIQFMRGLYIGGGQQLIEETFARIRGDKPAFSVPR